VGNNENTFQVTTPTKSKQQKKISKSKENGSQIFSCLFISREREEDDAERCVVG